MKTSLTASVLLLSGLNPAVSWSVPSPVSTRLPHTKASRKTWSFTRIYAQPPGDDDDNDAAAQARLLREKAEKVRLEAQEMEKSFVEQKLATLEKLLEKQSKLAPSEKQDIQDKIDRLKSSQKPPTEQQVISNAAVTRNEATENDRKLVDEMQSIFDAVMTEDDIQEEEEFVGELSEQDREALEEMQSIFLELQGTLSNSSIIASALQENEELASFGAILGQDVENALSGNITRDDLDFITGFTSFLDNIPGLKKNDVMDVIFKETKNLVEFNADIMEMEKEDPDYAERILMISELIPDQMQDSSVRVNQSDIEEFGDKVIRGNEHVFEMKSKPRKLGPYYILEGTPRAADGDVLLAQLDKQLSMSGGLDTKLQYFFFRDGTALVGLDEVQVADMVQEGTQDRLQALENLNNLAPPALLVMPAELTAEPATSVSERALLFSLSVLCAARFAGSCYNPDGNLLDQAFNGLSNPTVLFGLLGVTLAHELGHFATAALNKMEVAFPPFVFPSLGTGLLFTHTQPKSPPKNNKMLFDFALSGPLVGMATSWGMLAYGLLQTALAKTGQIAAFPHISLDFLNLSSLTSATIESLIGTDVLLSLDPVSENGVAVHPLVLAGHVGILMNALSLLPSFRTSDGGRMLQAVSTDTGIMNATVPGLVYLILLVQGFRDWKVSGMLVFYTIVSACVNQRDVPCRNSVDPAGAFRLALLLFTTLAAAVAVSPAF